MGRSIKDAAQDYFGGSIPEVRQQSFSGTGSSTASSAIQEAAQRWERKNEPDEYQHQWNDEGDEYVSAAYAAVAKKKEAEAEETGKKSLWERIKGFFTRDRAKNIGEAAISGTAAGYTGMERALYEAGQTGRTARYEEDRREAEEELARAKRDYQQLLELYNGDTSNRDVKSAQYVVDKWQREVDAYSRVIDDQVQQKATAATSELTHSLEQRSQKATEKAKEGLGTVGKIGVDAAVNILQMGGDALVGGAVGGFGKGADLALRKSASLAAMVSRVFGQGASEAEQAGATLGQQLAYGTTTAGIEYFTEKLFDGLAGLYGAGSADNITEAVIRRAASTPAGQNALRFILNMNEEGLEEVVSDILTPAAKMIYNGKNIGESYRENFNIVDTLYSYLIGAVASGGMNAVRPISTAREYQERNAKNTQISDMYKNMNENPNVFREFRDRGLVEAVSEGEEIPKRRQARAEQLWNAYNGNTAQQSTAAAEQAQQSPQQAAQDTARAFVRQSMENLGLSEEGTELLVSNYEAGETDAQRYVAGVREAFNYGKMGLSLEQAREEASFAADMSPQQFEQAHRLGELAGGNRSAEKVSSRAYNTPQYESIEAFSREFRNPQAVTNVYDMAADTDVNEFAEGFRAAYDMGQSGVSESYLTGTDASGAAYVPTLTEEQRALAYEMGRQDAATDAGGQAQSIRSQQQSGKRRVKGTVKGEGVSMADLKAAFNDPQRTAYRLLTRYAEATGVNIVLYNSQADANGVFTDAQGRFQWKDDTIYIDINSGLSNMRNVNDLGQYTMMRTFAHEFTHFIEKWSPAKYNEFREFAFSTLEAKGENVHDLIESKQAEDESGSLNYEQASREVVADAMMDILPDTALVQQLASQHQDIFRKLLQKLREFTARLKQYYREISSKAPREAQALKENGAYMQSIVDMWEAVARDAVVNYQGARGEAITETQKTARNSQKTVKAEQETVREEATKTRPVTRDRFPANDFTSREENAEDVRQQAGVTRLQTVGRDRFAPNDFTSTAEAGPDLKGMVPKRAQEAVQEQETPAEPETPASEESPAQAQQGPKDTPEMAELRASLQTHNVVRKNGIEYRIEHVPGAGYQASIRNVRDESGPYPIENARGQLYRSMYATRDEALDDIVALANNNGLLKPQEQPRKGSADAFANGDIFNEDRIRDAAGNKAATEIIQKMPEAPKTRASTKTSRAVKDWKNGTSSQKAAYAIIREYLEKGKGLPSKALYKICDDAFGGTQAEGTYDRKDAYDAMELAVNRYMLDVMQEYNDGTVENAQRGLVEAQRILSLLPTQNVRTQEQQDFQQFSTPPSIAYLTAWAAKISKGDSVLEPSAGIGGIATFAKAWGAEVTVNELSKRRLGLLQAMGFDRTFNENAEQIDNVLPDEVQPSIVVMNPPFSSTAGRTKNNKTSNAERHINQALERLNEGGRLVAVVGRGMADANYSKYWNKVREQYTIRANIGIDGENYKKYGTTFDVQIVVIDKTGPQGDQKTLTGYYKDLAEIPQALEGIRNDRNAETERKPGITGNQETAVPVPDGEHAVHPSVDQDDASHSGGPAPDIRDHDAGGGRESGNADVQRGERGTARVRDAGASERGAVEQQRPSETDPRSQQDERPDVGSGSQAVADVQGESGQQRSGLSAEPARRGQVERQEPSDDGVYATYKAPKLTTSGSRAHPATLVESAAMAAVDMPEATYTPKLPPEVVKNNLSEAQMVSVTYAGQAHEQKLPGGERRGFFIGDGTGVGKGRQISGIILDNFMQGRNKAVWISEKQSLYNDAVRDWTETTGRSKDEVHDLSKVKLQNAPDFKDGILYTTYDTLRTEKNGKSRVQQIADWFGKDFDGVIAFDEAHNMGNLLGKRGKFGKAKGSAKAMAAVELQRLLPNARVVYVSATAATEVDGLAFASRLGLWGKGTAFTDVNDFVSKIGSSGLAAMELVIRDMKAMGMYVARSISYNGVEYGTIQHDLDPVQRQIYDTMSRAWQTTMRSVEESLESTGAKYNSAARRNAIGQYYGAMQRFYNQVLTSMSMPSVIADMRKQLAAGKSCVLQIVNTNQAEADRQIASIKAEGGELDEMDLTPRGTLIDYLMKCYPVTQFEEYTDDDGNTQSRPVTNSKGEPVIDKAAERKRDALIAEIDQMSIPDGPLEMLFNAFGTDEVSEITGRTRRVVPKRQADGSIARVEEKRTPKHKEADVNAFQNGDKRILVFNNAGGTGKSYHADLRAKNQQQRVHYVLQPGWEASRAVQGFGRTHRSNEASAPIYKLVTTNIKGQKRFTSTIARRLDQLGALTKGQRDTGSGMFGASDNLETDLARDSLREFYTRLGKNKLEGIEGREVLRKLGLLEKFTDEHGVFKVNDTLARDISTFLNRILVLEVDEQNRVFDAFISIYETEMDAAIAAGTLDRGMENVKADKIEIVDDSVIKEQKGSGAATHYVQAKVYTKPKVITTVAAAESFRTGFVGMYRTKSGDVRAVYRVADRTTEWGAVQKQYKLQSPNSSKSTIWQESSFEKNAEAIPKGEWQAEWDKEIAKLPEYNEETKHMLTGALLPIWDSLPQEGNTKVQRLIADDGSAYLGRVIAPNQIDAVLSRFNVNRTKETFTAQQVFDKAIKSGTQFNLSYQRASIFRSKVSGEWRLEYSQPINPWAVKTMYPDMIMEKINWQNRYFIPLNDKGRAMLEKILEANPVANTSEETDTVQYSRRARAEEQTAETEAVQNDFSADGQQTYRVQYSRRVKDPETLKFLNDQLKSGKVVHTYKTFLELEVNGEKKLYPPMAARQIDDTGKLKMANAMAVGEWEESIGNPNSPHIFYEFDKKGNKVWKYRLNKETGNKSDNVPAAYDPYQHSSDVVLNDQFDKAYDRPNLVTYECIIPESELTSGYWYREARADGEIVEAALPVGKHPWKKGSVAGKLKATNRQVYLTRWLMPYRRLENSEVAQMYKDILDKEETEVRVPFNVVPPGLQAELEKIGVPIDYDGSGSYKKWHKGNPEKFPTGKPITQYSARQQSVSNRELLQMAAAEIDPDTLGPGEKDALRIFNEALDKLQEAQERREELGRQYREQQFTKGGSREEAGRLLSAMRVLDSKIKSLENRVISLENKEVLKNVLSKARQVAEQQERQRGAEKLQNYRAKRNESEATHKYRERVRAQVLEFAKLMTSPSNKDIRKHIPAELQKTVTDFLDSIVLLSRTALATNGLDTTKADERYLKAMKKLHDAIKENVDTQGLYSGYADLPADFIENFEAMIRQAEQHISDNSGVFVINQMSAAELKKLSQTLKTLKKYIVTMNTFHNNAMFQHVDEAGESSIGHLSVFRKARIAKVFSGAYKFLRFDYMRPSYAFEHFGDGGKSIERELRQGQATQAFLANKIIDFAKKTYKGGEVKAWSEEIKSFTLSGGEEIKLPVTHIMSLYCLNKRAQALTHIYGDGIRVANYTEKGKVQLDEGHLVNMDDVQKMVQSLTPRQIEVADALQKYMSTECAEWGNYVSIARFDVEQFGEENYFPINSDGRYLPATADESPDNAGLYALLNMGFTKELKENASNRIILYNIFDVFANHTASMTQYRSFALPVLDALKWFNYKNGQTSVRDQLSKAFGAPEDARAGSGSKGYAESFVLNLLRAYNGTAAQGDPYDTAALKFLHRYNSAAIAYNARVVIQQPTAIARAAMILSPAKLTKGLGMSTLHLRKLADEMEAHSGIAAWKRLGFYDTNISRGLTELIRQTPSVMDTVMDVGTAGAELADRYTWAAMWYAAKDSVKRSDYDSEEAYFKAVTDLFEDVIYKTQVVDSLLTKSEFLRSKGGIARQLGSFMSEPSATMSMLADAHFRYTDEIQRGKSVSEAWRSNGGNIAKTAAVYAIGQTILAAMQAVVDAWRDDDEKDPENIFRNFLLKYLDAFKGNVIEELLPFGKIPVVSEIYEEIKSLLDYAGVFDKLGLDLYGNDISSGLSMYLKYVNKTAQIIIDKLSGKSTNYTDYSVAFYLIRAVSNLTGLPAANVMREVQDVWNNTVGYFAPKYKLKTYERAADRKKREGYAQYVQQTGLSQATYNALYDKADVDGDGIEQGEFGPMLLEAIQNGEITEEQAAAAWKANWNKENSTTFEKWRGKNGGSKAAETPASSTSAPAATPKPTATPKPEASFDSFKDGVPIYGDKKQATYAVWESQLQGSMTLDRFKEILSKADADGNDSLKQDELGYALRAAVMNRELSYQQASAVWDAQGWKHNLDWWAGRHQ